MEMIEVRRAKYEPMVLYFLRLLVTLIGSGFRLDAVPQAWFLRKGAVTYIPRP